MSSAALAVTLTQTIPLWIGVKKGLSIEKVLEGLPKDSENRSACQSVLYTAVRQRALLEAFLGSDLARARRRGTRINRACAWTAVRREGKAIYRSQ